MKLPYFFLGRINGKTLISNSKNLKISSLYANCAVEKFCAIFCCLDPFHMKF